LIPNLMPKCECLSIHSSLPFEPRHHTIPQNQCKQSFCRTETNCRPQASLLNLLKKSSPVERDLSPSQAHKSAPLLYQFLVLTRLSGEVKASHPGGQLTTDDEDLTPALRIAATGECRALHRTPGGQRECALCS
jgi:hypothetical protein